MGKAKQPSQNFTVGGIFRRRHFLMSAGEAWTYETSSHLVRVSFPTAGEMEGLANQMTLALISEPDFVIK